MLKYYFFLLCCGCCFVNSQEKVKAEKFDLWKDKTWLRGANIFQEYRLPEDNSKSKSLTKKIFPHYSLDNFKELAAWGANYITISHPGIFNEIPLAPKTKLNSQAYQIQMPILENLERLVKMSEEAGLFVVIAYRTGPLRSEKNFQAGEKKEASLWINREAQQAWIEMWLETAKRFKDSPVVAGYELMVEPVLYGGKEKEWLVLAKKIITAIRKIDPQTPILIDGANWSSVTALKNLDPDYLDPKRNKKLVYAIHQYEPFYYSHQEVRESSCKYDNRSLKQLKPYSVEEKRQVEALYKTIKAFKTKYKVPVAINEFGASRWVPGMAEFISDQIALMEKELQANYAIWIWESSENLSYDDFNFRCGPDPRNFKEVFESDLITVLKYSWQQNKIRPIKKRSDSFSTKK